MGCECTRFLGSLVNICNIFNYGQHPSQSSHQVWIFRNFDVRSISKRVCLSVPLLNEFRKCKKILGKKYTHILWLLALLISKIPVTCEWLGTPSFPLIVYKQFCILEINIPLKFCFCQFSPTTWGHFYISYSISASISLTTYLAEHCINLDPRFRPPKRHMLSCC